MSVSDLWRGMASRKSHVSELKNWMPMHSKKKPSVGVELRAGGDPHRSEKPGWSASDMRQWQKKKIHRHPGGWEAPGDQWHGIVSGKSHRGCTVRGR